METEIKLKDVIIKNIIYRFLSITCAILDVAFCMTSLLFEALSLIFKIVSPLGGIVGFFLILWFQGQDVPLEGMILLIACEVAIILALPITKFLVKVFEGIADFFNSYDFHFRRLYKYIIQKYKSEKKVY